MGVSGCGKTVVGEVLAKRLDCPFLEGDEFHPPENIAKMRAGTPLNDDDRTSWMVAIRTAMEKQPSHAIVACSALKKRYRRRLGGDFHLVYLKGTARELARRLQDRSDHFMLGVLLDSQFAALEEPDNALVLDLDQPSHEIAEKIVYKLS